MHLVYYYDFSYFSLLRIIYPAGLFESGPNTLLVGNQFLRKVHLWTGEDTYTEVKRPYRN